MPDAIRQALYTRLAGDPMLTGLLADPGSVFHQVAPQGARTPFVLFHKQDGRPDWQFAGGHVQIDLWTVKAVDRSASASQVETLAARIDELLTDAPLPVSDRRLLTVYRETDIDYPEVDGADIYRHCGAMFRLISEPA